MTVTSPQRYPSRIYGGQASDIRVAKRRAQFIEAGCELFGTIGYRKTTVRALCERADLTSRYLYESFASMEDLLMAVYQHLTQEMQRAILQSFQSSDTPMNIAELIDKGLQAFFSAAENPVMARVVWLEVLGISPRIDALYNSYLRHCADLLLMLRGTSMPALSVSDEVARVLAMGLIGAASEAAKDWMMGGYVQSRETMTRSIALIFKGTLMGAEMENELLRKSNFDEAREIFIKNTQVHLALGHEAII